MGILGWMDILESHFLLVLVFVEPDVTVLCKRWR